MPLVNYGLGYQQTSGSLGDGTLPLTLLGPGDTFSQPLNTTRRYLVALVDPDSGLPIASTAYSSGTAIRAFIWEGGDGPILSSPTLNWGDPTVPNIVMEVDPSHLSVLQIQPYPVRIEVDRAGVWQNAWDGWIEVLYEPATAAALVAPGTYQQMIQKGGASIKQLLTPDSRAGFLEERAEAWIWLRQIIIARYRPPGGGRFGMQYLSSVPGYWVSVDYPNPVIAGYLDAGDLLMTDQIYEILARKALAILFDRQQDEGWRAQAKREHARAEFLLSSLVAGIDTAGTGYPAIVINCGVINSRDV